jgi:hypothetical protein
MRTKIEPCERLSHDGLGILRHGGEEIGQVMKISETGILSASRVAEIRVCDHLYRRSCAKLQKGSWGDEDTASSSSHHVTKYPYDPVHDQ